MNNRELFSLIKKDAEYFSIEDILHKNASSEEEQQSFNRLKYPSRLVAAYNKKTFFEIKSRDCIDVIESIDVDIFKEFTFRIGKYMDKHAPDQNDLKRYVQIVSTYLTFIVKKPLHPPGIIFEGGHTIVCKDKRFYCPVKNKQLNVVWSLCKYCVSRDLNEINEAKLLFNREV